jgi:hypothetical protein
MQAAGRLLTCPYCGAKPDKPCRVIVPGRPGDRPGRRASHQHAARYTAAWEVIHASGWPDDWDETNRKLNRVYDAVRAVREETGVHQSINGDWLRPKLRDIEAMR